MYRLRIFHRIQNMNHIANQHSTRSEKSKKQKFVLQKPHVAFFGIIKVMIIVVSGILVGAALSKNIVSFLEKNELFVPSDDDGNDDD
ncbi:hypothetical protein JTB14_026634 [Gonioctena quinquepunctata]|nr:hypothetical protein JTB14_026634 [Gonioctena quinquepunctata]